MDPVGWVPEAAASARVWPGHSFGRACGLCRQRRGRAAHVEGILRVRLAHSRVLAPRALPLPAQ
eukprot:2773493-Rhodomonas_salina.1